MDQCRSVEKRHQIEQKTLEAPIKFKEQCAQLDEQEAQQKSEEAFTRMLKQYQMEVQDATQKHFAGLSSEQEYRQQLLDIQNEYYDQVLSSSEISEEKKAEIIDKKQKETKNMSSIIKLSNATKKYNNGTTALRNISVDIEAGEFAYVVGPSGAGKSTFIRLLYREVKLDKGQGVVAGYNLEKIKKRDLPMLRRSIGVVFQDYKLLQNKTVYENIAYAMEVIGKRPREIKKRVMEVLDLVGLKHKVRSFPNELSGGEQQRVAIARSIANAPKVLIADEPTGNLDPENSWEIMNLLEKINIQGTTILMATHNSQIVNTLRHRVIAIENGRIVRDQIEGEYGYDD